AMKELYGKYKSLNTYDKIEGQVKTKLLQDEIKPEIARHFKGIITKLKQGENKDKMLRVIEENREELSDYLAFNIAVRKDIYIDGYGGGQYDFYDKSIQAYFKFRENKNLSEIWDYDTYRALAALVNLRDKNTALHFAFRDLNGKIDGFKNYPRKQDLLFNDLTLGDDFKNAMLLSTKNKQLKEKLIEKLKTYIDEKLYRDFLEYKVKDLESKNPKNSILEGFEDKRWGEEAFESYKKELEDLRANEKEKIKQIIDNGVKKGRDMQILGKENFTPEVVEYIHKNKAKVAIDKLEKNEAENLGFKYSDDVRLTIDSEAIQHTLKRHGAESDLVKNSGQIPVEYKDIAKYRITVKYADESLRARDNAGNDIIVSYKQINGYAVVVEQIRKKNNELSFKTMFKQNGDYKNSKSYKETSALNQTLSIGYEPSANSFSKTD
ncbi:hypothetical protein CUPS4244_09635, partial [Campylobacter upsaliensis]|uniref:PBECR3 domain-containing polyvalent protein n=1 Tax=Campylobacter upsaliensis TaxID=28080 RepID=UPI00214A44F8